MTNAIVFGSTGSIGTSLVEFLSKEHADWKIQAVSRSSSPSGRLAELNLPNVVMVQGDVEESADVLRLCETADLIYCCVGFMRYEAKYWAKHWPIVVENLLQATGSGKKLVFCDNLYAYGSPGEAISVRTARVAASTKSKPGVRATLHQRFLRHMKDFPGTLAVIGAADFFGPHVTKTSFLGDTCTGKIVVENASPLAVGSCNKIHDFCFAPDLSRALAVASVNDAAYDKFWIAPHSIHGKTLQEVGNAIAAAAGKPQKANGVKFTVLGPVMVYMLSPFMVFMREMREMLPWWTQDYTVDDSDFIKQFGVEATPMDEALDALVHFYQAEMTTK